MTRAAEIAARRMARDREAAAGLAALLGTEKKG